MPSALTRKPRAERGPTSELRDRFVYVAIGDERRRRMVANALRDGDFVVIDVGTGTEMLELLAPVMLIDDPCFRPDVLVFDAALAGISGAELACLLRQQGWPTPIFLLGDKIDGCFPEAPDPTAFCGAVRRACDW